MVDAPTSFEQARLLNVSGLTKSFYATRAVDDVSFSVDQGEIVALLGENGAGKSTVIKMLADVYKPDAGEITILGAAATPTVRKQISFVHQNLGLIEWMTVAENIALGLGYPRNKLGLISKHRMNAQAAEVLASIGGGIDPEQRIFDLPRAERSLLAIARGLVSKPKLLVLDEPTASLPAADVERLFSVLRTLRDSGVGMIYVSHRLDEVYQISQRAVVMRNGRVVADRPVSQISPEELVELIVGRETTVPRIGEPGTKTRLTLEGFRVDGTEAIDLHVRSGEILAICGLRGAGQEALGRAMAGATRPQAGSMTLDGAPFRPRSPRDAVDAGVAFATSNRESESVGAGLSVSENLFLNPAVWGRRAWQPRTARTESAEASAILAPYQIRPDDPGLPLDTFSGGNQQKVILARCFGRGRAVVILEEPTMGVDVGAKAEIYELLGRVVEQGTGAIVVSTDMEEVAKIAHRAIVLGRGRVVAELTGDDVTIPHLISAASDLGRVSYADPTSQESAA
ncbi:MULTISPECIES: sugar ABC transporter ATP-binding protein [Microbacterium]|uniref:sugar ABC transporter ATP-binding protein n=1 Tax=Microbacterium TaxID=33882 RepID=UPI002788C9EB|nr:MULTISPECIES: sugar ABC transporter ATP-binding protein [Microbacterium]MDQ1082723.1 ribose transport system ATP-binding protein [Microbacterium sp. SORGH_AS_0344]MDQ1168506.1 ribose transport system ATP-binding protein [Microbacterium proteolyticum]